MGETAVIDLALEINKILGLNRQHIAEILGRATPPSRAEINEWLAMDIQNLSDLYYKTPSETRRGKILFCIWDQKSQKEVAAAKSIGELQQAFKRASVYSKAREKAVTRLAALLVMDAVPA